MFTLSLYIMFRNKTFFRSFLKDWLNVIQMIQNKWSLKDLFLPISIRNSPFTVQNITRMTGIQNRTEQNLTPPPPPVEQKWFETGL